MAAHTAAALHLSHALGRVVNRLRRRWRMRTVARLVGGAALLRACTASRPTRADAARAARLRAMGALDFEALVVGQLGPHLHRKRRAIAEEETKKHELVMDEDARRAALQRQREEDFAASAERRVFANIFPSS